jgi:hypothetical protein
VECDERLSSGSSMIETTEAEGTGLNMLEIERLAKIVLG